MPRESRYQVIYGERLKFLISVIIKILSSEVYMDNGDL